MSWGREGGVVFPVMTRDDETEFFNCDDKSRHLSEETHGCVLIA